MLIVLVGLAGCDRADMVAQPHVRPWDRSTIFADRASMRPRVAGTEPRAEPNPPALQPTFITAALVERGHQRFDIFCAPCHGRAGDGQGMIVQRGFPAPPPLGEPGLVKARAAFLYDVITNGHGVMYSYADRVPPPDRWAIVAYIRALQLSQNAPATLLAESDRAALETKP